MNTIERINAVITELQDIVKAFDGGVPTPVEPPTPEPPKPEPNVIEKLKAVFTDPKRWSSPKQVWEFDEEQGGSFVAVLPNVTFDQRRSGRKPRFIEHGKGVHVDTFLDGRAVPAVIQDVKVHNGIYYCTAMFEKKVYVGLGDYTNNGRCRFDLKLLDYQGAKDASHALLKTKSGWNVYGRLRHGGGVDWVESDAIMGFRRGVRLVRLDNDFNIIDQSVLLDPAKTQPNYANAQMRYDYYASRACNIEGVEVLQISCFAKNQRRPIPNRPDRPDGSGHIYPIIALNGEVLSHTNTLVPTEQYQRRTEFKNNQPFEPEIGQLYGYGITYDPTTRKIGYYFSNRVDLHYYPFEEWEQPNVRIYVMEATL